MTTYELGYPTGPHFVVAESRDEARIKAVQLYGADPIYIHESPPPTAYWQD